MSDQARRSKRFPTRQELLVRCESWAQFAQLYAADVSQGGMFIVTDEPLEVLSEIDVTLQLPEGHEVTLRASIVHVIDREQAARERRAPGVGVQFVDLDPLRKQQIQQLVDYARWEGSSGGASYASRLFEVSTSLPPSKVLDALPKQGRGEFAASGVRRSGSPHVEPSASGAKASLNPGARAEGGTSRRPTRTSGGPAAAAARPPKATDPAKLKLGMQHLAHKRFDPAIKVFSEIIADNPGDRQAQQWLQLAHARLALKSNNQDAALQHYQKVLEISEDNHEARKFVREYHTRKRLNSIPFGRYFVKKR